MWYYRAFYALKVIPAVSFHLSPTDNIVSDLLSQCRFCIYIGVLLLPEYYVWNAALFRWLINCRSSFESSLIWHWDKISVHGIGVSSSSLFVSSPTRKNYNDGYLIAIYKKQHDMDTT